MSAKRTRKSHMKAKGSSHGSAPSRRFLKFDKRSKWRYISALLGIAAWTVAVISGILIVVGCGSSPLKSFYLAELNTTSDIQFRFGYIGGCVSVATTPGLSSNPTNSVKSEEEYRTHCLMNMHGQDLEDLQEDFSEGMPPEVMERLQAFLNQTLPISRHLQKDVFHWSIPLAGWILFLIGGIVLFALGINPTTKRAFKAMLTFAILMSAFALALVFTSNLGSTYSMKALGLEDSSATPFSGAIFIKTGKWLSIMQEVQLSFVALCYVFTGFLYIGPSTRRGTSH
ncbi:Nn.00g049010.m01.CDS01 [Neocucurbitaria sp. VM-36]